MNKQKNTFFIVFVTFLITSAMYLGAFTLVPSLYDSLPNLRGLGGAGFGEVEALIQDHYYKDVDFDKLEKRALSSYVDALGDPHSAYYTKSEYERFMEDFSGNYKGIGITVSINNNNEIVIAEVNTKGPAYEAGIQKGDILLAVDKKQVNGDNYTEAINMIRSAQKDAPPVVLSIGRGDETIEFTVERAIVELESVTGEMLEDSIAYVKVSSFAETTDEDFKAIVNRFVSDGAKSLIIDLRDNGGGMLTTVVSMADFLLPEGTILTMEGRKSPKQEFVSDEKCVDIPMVVLINGNSASASEVLSGALNDHEKAILVGETSFGKGVVQTMYDLRDGGALRITTSQYYTPKGECINEIGIAPDYEVVMELTKSLSLYEKSEDIQLQKAIELAKNQ